MQNNNSDKILEESDILNFFNIWEERIKKEKLKAIKGLRLEKINKINAKYK